MLSAARLSPLRFDGFRERKRSTSPLDHLRKLGARAITGFEMFTVNQQGARSGNGLVVAPVVITEQLERAVLALPGRLSFSWTVSRI